MLAGSQNYGLSGNPLHLGSSCTWRELSLLLRCSDEQTAFLDGETRLRAKGPCKACIGRSCRDPTHRSKARRLEVALWVVDVQLGVRAVHVACAAMYATVSRPLTHYQKPDFLTASAFITLRRGCWDTSHAACEEYFHLEIYLSALAQTRLRRACLQR